MNDKQDASGNDLTNTFVNDIVEVSGTKAWKNDTPDVRPSSVTVELLQNGKPFTSVGTQEATSTGGWKYTFTGLPKYDAAGQEYVYTVRETKVPDGYAQEIGTAKNGYAIMNTRIPLIDIPVKKVWKDNADYSGGHLAVTIHLLQNGVDIKDVKLSETSPTPWSHTFTGLPKTDAAGKEYRYTVTEDLVTAPDGRPGYKTTITGDPAGGFTVTNEWTKEDLITISGKKVWAGDDAIAAKERPDHVVLVLYRDGVEYSHTTATASGNWEYSFTSLPKHQDADPAKESVYTIEEESVDGYLGNIPEITVDEVEKAQSGDTIGNKDITNVFNNNVVTVSGIKQWIGDDPVDRPASVAVELLQNGKAFKTGTAAATDNWRYRFDNLPKYDSEGNLYTYTVNESAIPEGYAAKVSGTTITNTRIPLIDIPVTKVWENNDGFTGNNPDVVVHLLQNDVIIDTATIVASVDATPGGWYEATHVFKGPDDKGLPATDQAGVPYVYKVTEDEVAYQDGRKGYHTTILGDEKSGFTVINEWTEEDYIGIAGQKRWADDDAVQDAVRPAEVTLVLWRDGVEYRHLTVKAADNWAFKFGQLPKHKTGSSGMVESEYRITELPVEGYTASLPEITIGEVEATPHGGTIAGKGVVNTFDNSTSVSVRKVWEDSDNAAGKRPDSIEAVLLQDGKPFGNPVTLTGPEWKYTWNGLQEFSDAGELFVYRVEERNVPAGYSSRLGEGSQGGFVIINAADAPPGGPGTPGTPGTPDTPPGTPAVNTGDALAGVALALAAAAALGVGAMAVAARRARARQP